MPALTAAADLKTNTDLGLPLRLMDSFQSRTLLSDGISHKIPHFKSTISWRTTAHFISYQEIGQISHISQIKWHFRKFICTKTEASFLQTPISLKVASDGNFQNNWVAHKKTLLICIWLYLTYIQAQLIYMQVYTRSPSHPCPAPCNLSHTNKGCPRAIASHPAKQFSSLILVININSAIL